MRGWAGGAHCAVLLLAALAISGCMRSTTYGTGESPGLAAFREMAGGLGAAEEEPIAYQARAPLVLPPNGEQLPAPVAAADVANANWPTDPDRAAAQGARFGDDNPRDDISPEEYRRLKPLAGGDRARGGGPNWDENHNPARDVVDKKQRETFEAALNDANGLGRTERRFLTDPPLVLREPAAGAPTTFEDIDDKPGNFFTRWFSGS